MEPQGLDEIRPGCYDVHERVKDMNAGDIGIDNICWECDYPHSDSVWPDAPRCCGRADPLQRARARHQQDHPPEPMRWYHFDPFKHVPKEQATVGALRAAAAGHDVSVQGRSHQVISSAEKMAAYRASAEALAKMAQAGR